MLPSKHKLSVTVGSNLVISVYFSPECIRHWLALSSPLLQLLAIYLEKINVTCKVDLTSLSQLLRKCQRRRDLWPCKPKI